MSNSGLLKAFMELRPALLRYLSLRGARADEADDILQEVSLKLSSDAIGPIDQPRAYLYKMANNQFLLHRRTVDRRERREEAWVDAHSGEPRDIDEAPSAEAHLLAREQLAILQRVLDGLPDRTRSIFRCFRIEGQSQREIAAARDISISAVEKHLARAYAAIAAARLGLDGDLRSPRSHRGKAGRDGV